MKILLIEPFFGGSHAQWAKGLARHSSHEIEILSLPGANWKWRIRGGAITLAEEFISSPVKVDLLLASSMLDLTTFLALTRKHTAHIPSAIYFHENQFSYPLPPKTRTERYKTEWMRSNFGFINLASAAVADTIFFNSHYHQSNFLSECDAFIDRMPDSSLESSMLGLREKSKVLPLGLNLSALDSAKKEPQSETAHIVWNHRWEYDKNPDDFFKALRILSKKGLDFELSVLGSDTGGNSKVFLQAQNELSKHIRHWGYVDDFSEYAQRLWEANILPVTSNQEFFGVSVAEALYCDTNPILPNRLSYPELIPKECHSEVFYSSFKEFLQMLASRTEECDASSDPRIKEHISQFDWTNAIANYDDAFEKLIAH